MRSRSRCSAWLVAGCDRWIRIAARLTLASSSSASSATSRFRSSEDKFISRIYIIFTIDWKNEVRGGDDRRSPQIWRCRHERD